MMSLFLHENNSLSWAMTFDATAWGGMLFSLKILLFLASHIFQQKNLMEAFQTLPKSRFPCNFPVYCFAHLPIRLLVFVGLAMKEVISLYTLFITYFVKLQCRNRWFKLSGLLLHNAHLNGPKKPLLIRFSPVKILLWANCQQKILIFGRLFGFHISFQITDLGGMSLSSRRCL